MLGVSESRVCQLHARALMQALSESFRQAIGQRLGQDGVVIVIGTLEALGEIVLADAGRHHEGADMVGKLARARRHEIGERHVGAAVGQQHHHRRLAAAAHGVGQAGTVGHHLLRRMRRQIPCHVAVL